MVAKTLGIVGCKLQQIVALVVLCDICLTVSLCSVESGLRHIYTMLLIVAVDTEVCLQCQILDRVILQEGGSEETFLCSGVGNLKQRHRVREECSILV